jgi:hypothetical protein
MECSCVIFLLGTRTFLHIILPLLGEQLMSFHLIITCVAQKKVKQSQSILDPDIKSGSLEDVFQSMAIRLTG